MNTRILSLLRPARLPILSLLTAFGLVASTTAASAQATATATHTQWDIYGATASANVASILRDAGGKAGPAGSIWITTQNPQPRLGRLDPTVATNNYREWRFCPNDVFGCGDLQGRPLGLTLNEGNGDLWVANDGTPSLMVKVGLSNTFRLFVVDSEQAPNPGAQGVAVAPPGTLYADSAYVAFNVAKGIGRIPRAPGAASGCVAIPEVPGLSLCSFKVWKAAAAPVVEPRYVAVDAAGNVWYTDWLNNRLGRLTAPNEALATATSLEWSLPAGQRPAGIHFDGNTVCVVSEGLAATGTNPPAGSAVQCLDPITNLITVYATPTPQALDLPQQIARNSFKDLFVTESHGNGVVFIGRDAANAGTVWPVVPASRAWTRSSIPMYVTELVTAPFVIKTIAPTVVPMSGVVAGTEQLRFPFPTPEAGSPERYAQPYGITAAFDDTEPGSGTAFVAQFYSGPLGTFPDAGKVSKIEVVAAREIIISPGGPVEFTVTAGLPEAASVMRSITELKGLALDFTAMTTAPVPWLTLSPTTATATPGTLTLTLNAAVAAATAPGTYTEYVTVADAANRAEPKTITVTLTVVADTIPPVITVPGPITLEATGSNGATATFTVTATDNVPTGVTVECSPASGTVFALGTTVVECTALDAAGNTAQDSFSVTVSDTTPPVVTAPATLTVEATGPAGAAVSIVATATDLVSGSLPVTCTPASGSTFSLGVTAVSCSATDAAGNSATAPVSVTVRDTTAPSLVVPADFTSASPTVTYAATATDLVDANVEVTCTPASGTVFAVGPTTVICTATDDSNNTTTKSFVVTVPDTTFPTLTLPDPITAPATGATGATVTYSVTATDNVPTGLVVSCSPASGSVFPLGPTTVNCTATDAAGNSTPGSFIVTVVDTGAPIVTVPAPIVAEATGPLGAVVSFSATATDLVEGTLPVSCTVASGSTFAVTTTTVSCTATDTAGNTDTESFTVTVRDTTPPVLVVPADFTSPTALVTYTVTATDIVDTSVEVTCSPASNTVFAIGPTTVSCTAKDDANNQVTKSFVVTVPDTIAPTLNLPGPISASATAANGATVNYTVTVSDNLPGATFVCAPASGSVFPLGATPVNCTATDAAGNTTPGSFTVTVSDNTPPVITVPGPILVEATGPLGAPVTYSASAVDAVDGIVPVTCAPASGSTFGITTTNVACSAADAAGNKANTSFQVTVRDTTAPVFTNVVNATATATSASGAIVTYTIPTATDLVDGVRPVTCSPAPGTLFPIGATTVTCTASDTRTNGASATLTVTVAAPPVNFTTTPTALYFKTGRLAYCNGIPVGPNWKDQGLIIKNTGTTPLNYVAGTATSWLRVLPASGTLAAGASITLTVSVDLSHLGRGIYHGAVTVTGNGSLVKTVPVTLEIGNALPTLCPAPPTVSLGTLRTNTTYAPVAIGVVNVGDDPLPSWTVSKTITDGTLAVTPTSGTANATLYATVKTGKKRGNQSATVTINGSGTIQGVRTIKLTWTVK